MVVRPSSTIIYRLGLENMILVTGSSGFVASSVVPLIKETGREVVGVDLVPGKHTNFQLDISGNDFREKVKYSLNEPITIINLAAARFDFGARAVDYYQANIISHQEFINSIDTCCIEKFIHVSSVASFDGKLIRYSKDLNCDDAYRVTKYLQEKLIKNWCNDNNIPLVILYPSAIFSDDARSDTNIGKLQYLSSLLPFVPKINVKKSLTFLPNFSNFILYHLDTKSISKGYLTIERPLLSVTQIISALSKKNLTSFTIPGLHGILWLISWVLFILGGFGRIDLKLTPNRVLKLFSETSYFTVEEVIDTKLYNSKYNEPLSEVLSTLKLSVSGKA